MDAPFPVPPAEPRQRWRLIYARSRVATAIGSRDQQAAWEAVIVASELPAVGLDARPARPRIVLGAPIPAGIDAEREFADLFLTVRLPAADVRIALQAHLPTGHRLIDLADVWLGEAALPGQVVGADYRCRVGRSDDGPVDSERVAAAANDVLAAVALPRIRRKGDREIAYDLRPLLVGIELLDDGATAPAGEPVRIGPGSAPSIGFEEASRSAGDGRVGLRIRVRHDPERGVGRPEEVLAALADRTGTGLVLEEVVRERIVLAGDD